MTLRHFKIFVTVCDTMNMTAAAEALYMSQPAVSQAIAEMEDHYDVRLFERLSRKLYLTQAGQKLLSYARYMIRMNDVAENDMKALHENSLIRVGASVTVGTHVLPKLVFAYKQINSMAEVEVIEDNTHQIEQLILSDQIDLGLVEGDTVSPDILCRPFMNDELVLICSPKHCFAAVPMIQPEELQREEFIIREKGSGTRKTFEDNMASHHLSWNVSWTCNNADTIKAAVAQGLGVSVISKRSVENEVASGLLCQKNVEGLSFKRQFKAIYHKNKYLTESIKRFLNLIFFASVD